MITLCRRRKHTGELDKRRLAFLFFLEWENQFLDFWGYQLRIPDDRVGWLRGTDDVRTFFENLTDETQLGVCSPRLTESGWATSQDKVSISLPNRTLASGANFNVFAFPRQIGKSLFQSVS